MCDPAQHLTIKPTNKLNHGLRGSPASHPQSQSASFLNTLDDEPIHPDDSADWAEGKEAGGESLAAVGDAMEEDTPETALETKDEKEEEVQG